MKSRVNAIIFVVLMILTAPSFANGYSFSITDSTGINGIQYTLAIDESGMGTIRADTSGAVLPSAGGWYIGALEVKLEPKGVTNPILTSARNLTHGTDLNAAWAATDSENEVALQKFGKAPKGGFTLIYFDGIVKPSSNADSGASVNSGDTFQWMFTFDPVKSFIDTPSIKVLYYDDQNPSSGKFYTQQMSQSNWIVPEPATLILVGLGLMGVAGMTRKLKH